MHNKQLKFIAFDYGASNGRGMAGFYNGKQLDLEEIHRFPNEPVLLHNRLVWDFPFLFRGLLNGMEKFQAEHSAPPVSVGIDTWGVDFGFLDKNGELLQNPVHYRDSRTEGQLEFAETILSTEELYEETGTAFLPINSLYHLLGINRYQSGLLDHAETFLMMPDLLIYFLTGEIGSEFTNASTTQLLNVHSGTWSNKIITAYNLKESLFKKIHHPGTARGTVRKSLSDSFHISTCNVIAVPSHDTASAVLAVPSKQNNSCVYISSGTWSLIGVENESPVLQEEAKNKGFTNERGVGGSYRVLKNIMGLWLLQESRRNWKLAGTEYGYTGLVQAADGCPPFPFVINPNDIMFYAPRNMLETLKEFCNKTRQSFMEEPGAVTRAVLESLAFSYLEAIETLERLIGKEITTVHIVGGGTKNTLLNQFTANATRREVVCGPVEATALGNIGHQLISAGELSSPRELKDLLRISSEINTYIPKNTERWREQYNRYKTICAASRAVQ